VSDAIKAADNVPDDDLEEALVYAAAFTERLRERINARPKRSPAIEAMIRHNRECYRIAMENKRRND
jgi:hypothetical protein